SGASGDTPMTLPRRRFLQLTATATAFAAATRVARALDYPTRPVHLVVGYPPGNAPDIVARVIAPRLAERFGQQFVVDNRPGAAGNIGAAFAAKAAPDGYTLLMAISNNAINATLYRNLTFDFTRDFMPVGTIGVTSFVMATNPAFPAKTVPEFVAYAKA